jgi:hypothetical protein
MSVPRAHIRIPIPTYNLQARITDGISHFAFVTMSLFILIHCRFGLRLSTPNSSAALVLTESQTSPSDQNVRDIGGLPTLPCPLPGTSYGEPHI